MNAEALVKICSNVTEIRDIVLSSCIPKETHSRFQASRKEALLGIKSILEEAINRCDETGSTPKEKEQPSSSQSIQITG